MLLYGFGIGIVWNRSPTRCLTVGIEKNPDMINEGFLLVPAVNRQNAWPPLPYAKINLVTEQDRSDELPLVPACAVIVAVLLVGVPLFHHLEAHLSPRMPVQLSAVEVRSFQGRDLSSINFFHENSIAGPQHINESDYRLTVTGLTTTTRVLTYRDILANHQHYAKVVTLNRVEGWSVKLLLGRCSGPRPHQGSRRRSPCEHRGLYSASLTPPHSRSPT